MKNLGITLDLDPDYISELFKNGAGPPQATPNYWSIHTYPKPSPLGQKSLSSQLQLLVQLAGTTREERQVSCDKEGLFTLVQEGRTGQDGIRDRWNSAPADAEH